MDNQIYRKEIMDETYEAGKKHGYIFNSPHEGIAVLYEEFEELTEDVEFIKNLISEMWLNIKEDLPIEEHKFKRAKEVSHFAHDEIIQLATMFEKLSDYYYKK